MEENIKGQTDQEGVKATGAGASTKASEDSLDYKSLYHQEIKNAKSQREAKQQLSEKLSKIEAEREEKREAKLQEQGKHEEVIKELKSKIKSLEADSDILKKIKAVEREELLANFTDEEKEKLTGLNNEALKVMVSKISKESQPEHPSVLAGAARTVETKFNPNKPYSELTQKEKNENWKEYVDSFRKN